MRGRVTRKEYQREWNATHRAGHKEHTEEYNRTWFAEHPEYRREHDRERRARAQEFILQQRLGKVCALCSESNVTKLVFHHVDPATKLFTIGSATRSMKAIIEEIAKCVLWCRSCHTTYHKTKKK